MSAVQFVYGRWAIVTTADCYVRCLPLIRFYELTRVLDQIDIMPTCRYSKCDGVQETGVPVGQTAGVFSSRLGESAVAAASIHE